MRALAAISLSALVLCGCVERELRVETDPAGADVYIDGKPAGKTPLTTPFVFYGTRGIVVRHAGFTPAERIVPVRAPWFQIIPLDLFFEHVWPGTLRDLHEVTITMEPAKEMPAEELLERAKAWRADAETPAPK